MESDELARSELVDKAFAALRETPVPGGPSPGVLSTIVEAGGVSGSDLQPITLRTRSAKVKCMRRIAVAAALLVGVCLGVLHFADQGDRGAVFAHVLEQIDKAKTITWKTTYYTKATSQDGKRSWIKTETAQHAYQAPGLYRDARFDDEGKLRQVEIEDVIHGKKLELDYQEKTATLHLFRGYPRDAGPFDWFRHAVKGNLEWIGKKRIDGREANGFREAGWDKANNEPWSSDFWVDAKTKRLVTHHVPGADVFDPDTHPAHNNPPEKEWSRETVLGHIEHDIVFDAALDDAVFRLEPPEGFTLKAERRREVTEEETIRFLGILAKYYDNTFPDQLSPVAVTSDKLNAVEAKPKEDRTPAEQKLFETVEFYKRPSPHRMPIGRFRDEHTAEGTWRYLGKGVQLGDADRIVCWYQPKGSQSYRIVCGDLSVRDVAAQDLPLSVKAFEQMGQAKTVTWKTTFYARRGSKEGKTRHFAYQAPGLYRDVALDADGEVRSIDLEDNVHLKRLLLQPNEKKATAYQLTEPSQPPRGPLTMALKTLRTKNLEWLGTQEIAGREAIGFRHGFWFEAGNYHWSYDFWIDAETKRLVRYQVPGSDVFEPGRQAVEEHGCFVMEDIVFGAELDDSLFRLDVPEGYALTAERRVEITEEEVIEFLGIVAEYFDKTFPDRMPGFDYGEEHERLQKLKAMPKEDRTPAQDRLVETIDKYMRRWLPGPGPTHAFLQHNTVEGSRKYLGKRVKLGDAGRIVCWYRPNGSETYRVVYGDLSVRDVAPDELPLEVQP